MFSSYKILFKFRIFLLTMLLVVFCLSFIAVNIIKSNFVRAEEAVNILTKEEKKQQLEVQLKLLEIELQKVKEELAKNQSERQGHSRDSKAIENDIAGIRLEIKRNQVVIDQTSLFINLNEDTLDSLEIKMQTQKELLSKLLLDIYKIDDVSTLEIILTSNSLSDFFNDVANLKNLQKGMQKGLNDIKAVKKDMEKEKSELEERMDGQVRLLQIQQIQNNALDSKLRDKEILLKASIQKENQSKKLAENTQRTIEQVRNQLFVLEGAGVATSFGEAYEYAKVAGNLTGIRPAFLLAVLKRESSWGANVGQCYLVDPATGLGKGKNSGTLYPRTMKSTRDVEPFMQITQELGKDLFSTPVSCPHPKYGYGGAMGPAQFLPSTWMAYRDRVAKLIGRTPNPWLIQDAFIASAVKLAAAGAANHEYSSERKAALIYYAGGGWNNPLYWPYTDAASVGIMALSAQYQNDINILEGK